VLESLDLSRLKEDGYGFQIEIDHMIWRKGFRIKEIPIIFVERRPGSRDEQAHHPPRFWLVIRIRLQRLFRPNLEDVRDTESRIPANCPDFPATGERRKSWLFPAVQEIRGHVPSLRMKPLRPVIAASALVLASAAAGHSGQTPDS